ncbi:MAG: caspase family protein [Rhizobacter sp.]
MKRRAFALATAAALATLAAPAWAVARRREALVIGNDAYPEVPLRNPGNDASAVSRSLIGLGFNVRLLRDAGWRSMIDAVQSFVSQSSDAEVRLVFYAGHGAQVRGQNYLIPVDAPMTSADELTARSLNANEILERMGRDEKGLNLLILDACRNNPANRYTLTADGRRLKVRGAAKGLAAMQPPQGTLVAFSTSPGQVADDGKQQANSLYTRHLLRHMGEPGLPLEQMFKRVRIGVMNESAQRQRPWEESSLTVDYCMAGC